MIAAVYYCGARWGATGTEPEAVATGS